MSRKRTRLITLLLSSALALLTFKAATEDIDIFSIDEDSAANKPNVLIVLDNSANWSRQSQQWPGGLAQGQSEARAIKAVLSRLADNSVNLGLLEFSTEGASADQDGGYVRHHIRPVAGSMTDPSSNRGALAAKLDRIFNNINEPIEKRPQGNPFGTIMWEVFNYLGGLGQSKTGAGTPSTLADTAGYSEANFSKFRSPLGAADACQRTIVIFIGNNTQSGPSKDDTPSPYAIDALERVSGSAEATEDIPIAEFRVTSQDVAVEMGSSSCYASSAACTTAVSGTSCTDQGFKNCACGTTGTECPLSRYTVYGRGTTQAVVSGPTNTVESDVGTGDTPQCQNNAPGSYTCPLPSTVYTSGPEANQTTQTDTTWSSCAYVAQANACGNNNNKTLWTPKGTRTQTVTVRETTNTDTELGASSVCGVDANSCGTASYADCSPADGTPYSSCFCASPSDTTGCGGSGLYSYPVTGVVTQTTATPTGRYVSPSGGPWAADEWAAYLANVGVPMPGTATYDADGYPEPGTGTRVPVTTYTLDVFNAQQDADFSGLLFNMARVSGGRYYQAKNEDQIEAALEEILAEVQAVNTAFASASLPVSATNRAQNENQVFIGLFRPDRLKQPLWFGNLKRYEVIADGAELVLGDSLGKHAINNLTGFISECAVSFWTADSGAYWDAVITDNPAAVGICGTSAASPHADLPDGPFVEKGAVSQVLREANREVAGTTGSNGRPDYPLRRNVITRSGSSIIDFDTDTVSIPSVTADESATIVRFVRGEQYPYDDDNDGNLTEPRSTIHGDVVHSRPQPVNYGIDADHPSGRVVVYYGANDGTFRAVNAVDGKELWAFVAPEHYSKLARLKNNSPNIKYADDDPGLRKDYFFDGSTGLLQNAESTRVWIFPTMRRGGNKVYAFDVSDPAAPLYKWSKGCDLAGVCDSGFEAMGQSWSQPNVAFVDGYDNPDTDGDDAVIVYGGGYDTCEDAETATPDCSAAKGKRVYVVDANTGTLLRAFTTERSVPADIAMIDLGTDGKVDLGYAVDTGGNVYRINFAGAKESWTMTKVAYTDGDGRKFLYPPALLQTRKDNGTPVIYLALGSGDREQPLRGDYPYIDPITNRFYLFKDEPQASPALDTLDLDDEDEMSNQTVPTAVEVDQSCGETQILPGEPERGWFFDITENGRGEQVVTSAVIAGGVVYFSTNRAEPLEENQAECTVDLGEARGYAVNLVTGAGAISEEGLCGVRSDPFVGGGLPPSPVLATVPVEGAGTQTVCIGCAGRASPLDTGKIRAKIPSIRQPIYWYTTGETE